MKRMLIALVLVAATVCSAEKVAVFPVVGINADKSFIDAFGALFANKYASESKINVIPPINAGRAIGEDSSLVTAAQQLGASEYIEIHAVGLYVSRKEEYSYHDSSGTRIVVAVVNDDDDDDDDDEDQDLLDNQKTIVTATRFDAGGIEIYRAEMTLLTYGDIEEASERMALALHRKMTVEQTMTMTNVTRREGMGHNKTFAEGHKGVKMSGIYAVSMDATFSPMVTIGFDYRADAGKFFLEFGAGGRIPSAMMDESERSYGGNYFELGGSYFFINNNMAGVYGGLGVIPFFNWMSQFEMGLAPYLQFGVMMPRTSQIQFYIDLRVAQNVMPITTGEDPDNVYYSSYEPINYPPIHTDRPTEIGMAVGIAF